MVSGVGGGCWLLTCVTWNSSKNTDPWALLGWPRVSRTLRDPESISSQEPGRAESLCGGFRTSGSSLPTRTQQVDASLCQAGECLTFSHMHAHASTHTCTHTNTHTQTGVHQTQGLILSLSKFLCPHAYTLCTHSVMNLGPGFRLWI